MFSGSVNDTSRAVRMTIVGDATTWSITSDNSRDVIYGFNIFIVQATDFSLFYYSPMTRLDDNPFDTMMLSNTP
jgi:hypothetical protein